MANSSGWTKSYCGTEKSGLLPSIRRSTSHEVAAASTTKPNTGALRSPMISSSENKTAARGVLNAAAIAAAVPAGMSDFTCSGRSPMRRPSTEAMPAPTWAEGPSRPSGIPLASVAEVQKNFPNTVRKVMTPSPAKRAAFVWGTPLPPRVRKIAKQQVTHRQRACHGNQDAAPGGAAHWVQPHSEPLGEGNESHDRQAR